MLKGRYYVLEDVFRESYPEADENKLKKLMTEYRVKSRQKVKAIYINKGQLEEVNSKMMWEDQRFRKDVEELWSKDPNGSIRIYVMSSDGVKLKFKQEISLADAYYAVPEGGIESYLHGAFGGGAFCLKLLSTKYGRNLLIGKYRFYIG
jgi:hypothetical protein